MEFHGAELSRSWVKLAAAAAKGATTVILAEPVTRLAGRRPGDRHGHEQAESARRRQVRERPRRGSDRRAVIRAIEGTTLYARCTARLHARGERELFAERSPT